MTLAIHDILICPLPHLLCTRVVEKMDRAALFVVVEHSDSMNRRVRERYEQHLRDLRQELSDLHPGTGNVTNKAAGPAATKVKQTSEPKSNGQSIPKTPRPSAPLTVSGGAKVEGTVSTPTPQPAPQTASRGAKVEGTVSTQTPQPSPPAASGGAKVEDKAAAPKPQWKPSTHNPGGSSTPPPRYMSPGGPFSAFLTSDPPSSSQVVRVVRMMGAAPAHRLRHHQGRLRRQSARLSIPFFRARQRSLAKALFPSHIPWEPLSTSLRRSRPHRSCRAARISRPKCVDPCLGGMPGRFSGALRRLRSDTRIFLCDRIQGRGAIQSAATSE